MRKISPEDDETAQSQPSTSASQLHPYMEKKQRKKWTAEETDMLVKGCNKVRSTLHDTRVASSPLTSQWGVGNWKAILNDPDFVFDNRSPVDLKDRYAAGLASTVAPFL